MTPTKNETNANASKSVSDSRITLSQLMRPNHANFGGKVHGGTILALIDEAAYTCASKYAEGYCITAAMDQIEFLSPVDVGDVVTLNAAVYRTDRSSMDIGIIIECENPRDPTSKRRTNQCYVTMVAVDATGSSVEVPTLILETASDRSNNCEAELRRRLRQEHKEALNAGVCAIGESDPA